MKPNNLIEMLYRTVTLYPDNTALMWKEAGRYQQINYQQLWENIKNVAMGLAHLGICVNDKVAILSENNPRWPMSDFAISSLGAVSVPIYPTQTVEQTAYVLKNAECKAAIVENEDQMNKVIQGNPEIQFIIVMYSEGYYSHEKSRTFESVIELGAKESFEIWRDIWKNIKSDQLATIIHTSGTTGNPKGAMLTHQNFLANIEGIQFWILEARPDDILLSYLPLSHVFERTAGQFVPLNAGAAIAYAENLKTIEKNIMEVRPTVMTSVPRLFEKVYTKVLEEISSSTPNKKRIFDWALKIGLERYDFYIQQASDRLLFGEMPSKLRRKWKLANRLVYQKVKEKLGGRMRGLISGGAALNPEIARFFWAIDIPIMEGYGLTETAPVISANPISRAKVGTVGKPLPNLEVKLAGDGEILVRGPNVMEGYYKNEEATLKAIEEGWFKTGDLGEFDQEGYLKIVDRKKSIIILSTGKNVAPQPIESEITQSSFIDQAVLIGQGRKFVTALVTPDFDYLIPWAVENGIQYIEQEDLIGDERVQRLFITEVERLTKNLSQYEQPKRALLFNRAWTIEKGEITPSLKVRTGEIEKQYTDLINKLYDNRESGERTFIQKQGDVVPLILRKLKDSEATINEND